MSTMKSTFLLILLLKWFHQSDCCKLGKGTLVCDTIPTEFPSGGSTLWFMVQDIGEINSTVFHHNNLVSITSAIFKGAGITGIGEGAFSSFLRLESLDLDQNKLTNINHKWLERPATLTELSMSENQINVLSGAMLDRFTNLNKLDLRRNQINIIQPHTFSNLAALSFLDLSDNNLPQLTSKMFSPMHSINMSLHGNQWQCSCDAKDFFEFIMDLKNRSLLLHPDDVTCASPPSLRGHPVWNISKCNSSPSPGPMPASTTSATSPDLKVSSSTTYIKTAFNLRTTDRPEFLSEPPQPPPYTTNIVPMLITVIVVLCFLLLLVIFLAVLYRRKRNRKTVAPKDQDQQVSKEKDHQKTHITGHMRWDIETLSPVSLSEARAKSANAILFTSPFGVPGDCDGDPALWKDGENKRGEEEVTGGMTEIGKDNSTPSIIRNLQNENTPVNCENVPYLSIGSHLTQHTNVDMKSPLAKLGMGMHRISTWPPTAVQWQERCKREKEKEGTDNVVTAWTKVEFKVSSNLDNTGILSNNYDQNDTDTLRSNAENQRCCKEVETQIMKDLEETSTLSDATSSSVVSDRNDLTFKTSFVNVETPVKDHKISPKMLTLQKVKTRSSNGAYNSGRSSKQRGEIRRSISNAPSDGGGEYVFVDLLHEVVQNRGRWTRDRWRQIHMNKQTQEQQSHR